MKILNRKYNKERLASLLSRMGFLPRWIVFFIDIFILTFSFFLCFPLLENTIYWTAFSVSLGVKYFLVLGINIVFIFLLKTYKGIVRHSTFHDLFKIMLATVLTALILSATNALCQIVYQKNIFSYISLLLYSAVSFVLLVFFRIFVKETFRLLNTELQSNRRKIFILGTDADAVAIAKAIFASPSLPFSFRGFLAREGDRKNAFILGKKIIKKEDFLSKTKEELGIDAVLINKNILSREELHEWVNVFLEKGLVVLKTPSIRKMRPDEKLSINEVQIEDLLGRKPIVLENEEVKKNHFQKNILITGGAGSIGSEIVRQVASFNPALVVVLDQAETPLYNIELEMKESYPHVNFHFILADISNKKRLEPLFEKYNFSIVYHAAAYKHVPLMEKNPHEAVLVNIKGSKILALLSSNYRVDRFVMISTDKAVNPTNVMGASKRAAELFVQALQGNPNNTTKFITTRFGNVLGSNGSVIPLFKKQISNGGPITITHPDIVRYFMTIPEACELVLQAGTMGSGGEIFVFDMGEPVKILHLATRMIKLSGFEPNVDIKIVYTGLRPGEKLYEELLSDNTKTMPTPHEKIMISKDELMTFDEIDLLSEKIIEEANHANKLEVVRLLKRIVKEFKSNNSIFEVLDEKENTAKVKC